jgi:heme/copper-type cytochrome/quinol oxidase subunit 3
METAIPSKKDVFADYDPEVKIRTKKMMMYLIIFAIVMLFAGLTSVVLVTNQSSFWVRVQPPAVLWWSNLLVALASGALIMALRAIHRAQKGQAIALTLSALALGIAFCFTQSAGWNALSAKGLGATLTKNENGSWRSRWNSLDQITGTYGTDYTITYNGEVLQEDGGEFYSPSDALKANPLSKNFKEKFNTAGALICVLIFLHIAHLCLGLIYLIVNVVRLFKGVINRGNSISLRAAGMYWHFMGILWLYLFFFLFFLY